MRKFIRGSFMAAALAVFLMTSCSIVDPVDPVVNNNAQPPTFQALNLSEISSGQYIAGTVYINMDIDSSTGPVSWAALLVDDSAVGIDYYEPYQFQLKTADFPDGEYFISIALKQEAHNLGLLGLIPEVPSIICSLSVFFDQTPPTPVTLDSVVWDNGSPRLYWQASNDNNFYAYMISRNGNFGPGQPMGPENSVFERNTTTFLDTDIPMLYGIDIEYEVYTTNRVESATSNAVNIRYGDTLAMIFENITNYWMEPMLNPTHDILYAIKDSSINAVAKGFSTTDNMLIAEGKIGSRTEGLVLSKDGTRLFVQNGNKIFIFDASTLTVTDTLDLPSWGYSNSRLATGRDDRLYISASSIGGFDSGSVRILNAYTGALEGETVLDAQYGWLLTSSDNNTLYVAHDGYALYNPGRIFRLDISTDTAIVEVRQELTDDYIKAWQLSPDDNLLYILYDRDFIDVRDATTLAAVDQIQSPSSNPGDGISNFYLTESFLYLSAATSIPGERYFKSGYVHKYDRSNLSELGKWGFVMVPSYLAAASNDEFIYAFSLQPFLITVQ